MPDPGLATIYRDRMWTHQCGHACYHEVTTRDLHPGSIGFFDERARWKQILDLRELQPSAATPSSGRAGLAAKLSELSKLGEDLEFEDRPPMLWGPKLSDGTRGVEVDLKAGSTLPIAAAIPVEFGTVVQYKSDDSFGAVLLTGKEVYEAGIKFESPCTQWVKDNARKLLELRPEVKEHGIYVVRTVWSTEDVSLNAWMKRDKAVTVGFSAKVAGVAEVGPKGSFHHGGEDEGWIYYKADNDKERIVCFADCLHFEFNIFKRVRKLPKSSPPSHGAQAHPLSEFSNTGVADHSNAKSDSVESKVPISKGNPIIKEEQARIVLSPPPGLSPTHPAGIEELVVTMARLSNRSDAVTSN